MHCRQPQGPNGEGSHDALVQNYAALVLHDPDPAFVKVFTFGGTPACKNDVQPLLNSPFWSSSNHTVHVNPGCGDYCA